MYFKLDESWGHSNFYFILEFNRANFAGRRVNEIGISNLTDKFVLGITLFTQIIVSFLAEKK